MTNLTTIPVGLPAIVQAMSNAINATVKTTQGPTYKSFLFVCHSRRFIIILQPTGSIDDLPTKLVYQSLFSGHTHVKLILDVFYLQVY